MRYLRLSFRHSGTQKIFQSPMNKCFMESSQFLRLWKNSKILYGMGKIPCRAKKARSRAFQSFQRHFSPLLPPLVLHSFHHFVQKRKKGERPRGRERPDKNKHANTASGQDNYRRVYSTEKRPSSALYSSIPNKQHVLLISFLEIGPLYFPY